MPVGNINATKPLCVIPARRGSKRLPLKNILPIGGVPMVAHSILAAKESGVFDGVFVSTEDQEIASIAREFGANVHVRSDELAGDLVSATDVCLDVADAIGRTGVEVDSVVCLQPSSPLRTAADINESWSIFKARAADYLVSVTAIDPHYFHWAVQERNEQWGMFFGTRYLVERPLLPAVFRPNGAIKIARLRAVRETRNFFGENLAVYEMPEARSIHVAEQFDFDLAEFLLNRGGTTHVPIAGR